MLKKTNSRCAPRWINQGGVHPSIDDFQKYPLWVSSSVRARACKGFNFTPMGHDVTLPIVYVTEGELTGVSISEEVTSISKRPALVAVHTRLKWEIWLDQSAEGSREFRSSLYLNHKVNPA